MDKYRVLRREALVDLKHEAYTKAVSAFWFSIEALLRALLIGEGKTPPERPGKLISFSIRTIFSNMKNPEHLARLLNTLYTMRTLVDHRDKIADKDFAEKAYRIYLEAIEMIRKMYPL